jgi:hypothetical protein
MLPAPCTFPRYIAAQLWCTLPWYPWIQLARGSYMAVIYPSKSIIAIHYHGHSVHSGQTVVFLIYILQVVPLMFELVIVQFIHTSLVARMFDAN